MGTGKTYSTKYLLDSNNSSGVAGQVLSTTSTGIDWVDANTVPGTGLWLANGNDIYNSNSGNVGIGLTNPDTLLHLKSSGPKIKLQDTGNWGSNATGGVEFYDQNSLMAFSEINSAGDYLNYLVEAGNMTFGTSNTERMRIDSSGNVGIGTTSPFGATANRTAFSVNGTNDVTLNIGTGGTQRGYIYSDGTQTRVATVGAIPLTLGANDTERMRIDSSGNVGIGTTSPSRGLDVTQTALIQGAGNVTAGTLALGPRASGVGKWSTISGAHYNQSSGSGNGSGAAGIMIIGTYASNGENDIYVGGGPYEINAATRIGFYTHTTNTSTAGGSLRMNIIANGNVGIGTDLPIGKLTVQGDDADIFLRSNDYTIARLINRGSTGTDLDTGLFSLFVENTENVRIDANGTSWFNGGNVGIGTTSPSAKLEVRGTAATYTNASTVFWGGTTNNDNHNGITLSSFGDALGGSLASNLLYSNSNTPTQTNTNRSSGQIKFENTTIASKTSLLLFGGYYKGTTTFIERMRIDSDGNVGIGTTSPGAKLSVQNTSTAVTSLLLGNNSGGTGDYQQIVFQYSQTDTSYRSAIRSRVQAGGVHGGNLSFWTDQNGTTTLTERMTIDRVGNVGIGTASPDAKLHVKSSESGASTPWTNADNLVIEDSGNAGLAFQTPNTGAATIAFQDPESVQAGFIQYLHDVDAMRFATNGNNERIRIDSSGNVGIGISDPVSYGKFVVQGTGNLINANASSGAATFQLYEGGQGRFAITTLNGSAGAKFELAGTEKIRIDSSGNVGIGTTSPTDYGASANTLEVRGASGTGAGLIRVSNAGNTVGAAFYSGSASSTLGTQTNHELNIATNNTSRVVIDNTGAVKFNAYAAGTLVTDASGNISVSSGGGAGGPYLPLSAGSSYPLTGDLYQTMGAIGVAQTDQDYIAKIYELNSDGFLSLYTGQPTPLEKVRISSYGDSFFVPANNGKIGIGTTSPIGLLEVSKDSTTDGLSQAITVSSSSVTTKRMNLGYVPGSNYAFIDVINYGISNTDQALSLQPNGGNVGIGTASPDAILETSKEVDGNQVGALLTNTRQAGTADSVSLNFGLGRTADGYIRSVDAIKLLKEQQWTGTPSTVDAALVFSTVSNETVSEKMRITSAGNVGIGTDNPLAKFAILTSGTFVLNSNGNDYSGVNIQMKTTNTAVNAIGSGIVWNKGASSRKVAAITNYIYGDPDQSGLNFYVQPTSSGSSAVLTEAMRITNTGNVGIGTDTPDSKLDVTGGDITVNTSGTGFMNFKYGSVGSESTMGSIQTTGIDLKINATSDLLLLPGGNVGIGTTSPGGKLDIAYTGTGGTGTFGIGEGLNIGSFSPNITFNDNSSGVDNYSIHLNQNVFTIGRYTSATAQNPDLVLKSGNVGIGTTSPSVPLDVEGKIRSSDSNSGDYLEIFCDGSVSGDSYIENTSNNIQIKSAFATSFSTSGSVAMFIDNSQNVGIGTTSPGTLHGASYGTTKLHIDGGTDRGQMIIEGDTFAAIVLSDNGTTANQRVFATNVNDGKYTIKPLNDNGTSTVGGEAVTVLHGGNVGIGILAPQGKMTVVGATQTVNMDLDANSAIGLSVMGVDSNNFNAFTIGSANSTNNCGVARFKYNGAGSTNNYLGLGFYSNDDILNVKANGTVGIGTTSPGAKLDVNGIIFAGDGNKATPGYSFASDPDTGMFRDSANVLVLGVNADTRIRINNNDIVTYKPLGVNTTSITSGVALDVGGVGLIGDSGVGDFYLGNYATANHFRFHTNNSNTYFDMNCGDIYWRQGTSTRYQFFASTANMTIQGTLTQNSDARTKENVIEISDCISKVKAIRGVYYNRTDFNTEVTKVGVIAQEVEAVLPELVLESPETGLKSVAYSELTSVLINAIKEQQEIIEDLKTRITKLEN